MTKTLLNPMTYYACALPGSLLLYAIRKHDSVTVAVRAVCGLLLYFETCPADGRTLDRIAADVAAQFEETVR